MEAHKERSNEGGTVVTFYAPDRTFARVYKGQSLQETKSLVRQKLGLLEDTAVQLSRLHDGKVIELDDDEDFEAFRYLARIVPSLDVAVVVGQDVPHGYVPQESTLNPTYSRRRFREPQSATPVRPIRQATSGLTSPRGQSFDIFNTSSTLDANEMPKRKRRRKTTDYTNTSRLPPLSTSRPVAEFISQNGEPSSRQKIPDNPLRHATESPTAEVAPPMGLKRKRQVSPEPQAITPVTKGPSVAAFTPSARSESLLPPARKRRRKDKRTQDVSVVVPDEITATNVGKEKNREFDGAVAATPPTGKTSPSALLAETLPPLVVSLPKETQPHAESDEAREKVRGEGEGKHPSAAVDGASISSSKEEAKNPKKRKRKGWVGDVEPVETMPDQTLPTSINSAKEKQAEDTHQEKASPLNEATPEKNIKQRCAATVTHASSLHELEPAPMPEPESEPESASEPEPEPEPETELAPVTEPQPASAAEPQPAPATEPLPTPAMEPEPEPEPVPVPAQRRGRPRLTDEEKARRDVEKARKEAEKAEKKLERERRAAERAAEKERKAAEKKAKDAEKKAKDAEKKAKDAEKKVKDADKQEDAKQKAPTKRGAVRGGRGRGGSAKPMSMRSQRVQELVASSDEADAKASEDILGEAEESGGEVPSATINADSPKGTKVSWAVLPQTEPRRTQEESAGETSMFDELQPSSPAVLPRLAREESLGHNDANREPANREPANDQDEHGSAATPLKSKAADEDPLFIPSSSQRTPFLPEAESTPFARDDDKNSNDEDDDEDDSEPENDTTFMVPTTRSRSSWTTKTTYAPLTVIASQALFPSQIASPALFSETPRPTGTSKEIQDDEEDDDDDDDDDDDSSEQDSSDSEGEAKPKSHIPPDRRAGMQKKKRRSIFS